MQWVANAYLLMLGALILVGGGLGDRVGRKLIFLIGIVAFTRRLADSAPSRRPWRLLIAARALQGIGAALLVPQSLAIIAATFPKDIRGKAIGTWAAASAVTTALGPPIGGFLIDLLSWRAAFWINLPLAVVALWLAWRYMPESRDEDENGRHRLAWRYPRRRGFRRVDLWPERNLRRQRQPDAHFRRHRRRAHRDRGLRLCGAARGQPDHAADDVPLQGIHKREYRDGVPVRCAERRALPRSLRSAGAARPQCHRRPASCCSRSGSSSACSRATPARSPTHTARASSSSLGPFWSAHRLPRSSRRTFPIFGSASCPAYFLSPAAWRWPHRRSPRP